MTLASVAFSLSFFAMLVSWASPFGPAYPVLVLIEAFIVVTVLSLGHLGSTKVPRRLAFSVFPLVFLTGEYIRSLVPWGGTVWGGLGYSLHRSEALLDLAPLAGVWGLSLGLVLVNSLVAEALLLVRECPKESVLFGLCAGLVPIAWTGLRDFPWPNGKTATIAIVQGNVPEERLGPHEDDEIVFDNHLRLSRGLRGERDLDLIVWPENAIDRDLDKSPEFARRLQEVIGEIQVPFLVNAQLSSIRPQPGRTKNVSILYSPDGSIRGIYAKQHLVPVGEYIPHRRFLARLIAADRRISNDMVPGSQSTVFDLPEGRFASVICFESGFPGLVRSFVNEGARFLVFTTNNAAFGRQAQSAQNLAINQLRAAEHRMWVVQAAVSGISAVIAPDGSVDDSIGLYRGGTIVEDIRIATRVTPYARLGDWLPRAASAIVVGLWVWSNLDRLRSRNQRNHHPGG